MHTNELLNSGIFACEDDRERVVESDSQLLLSTKDFGGDLLQSRLFHIEYPVLIASQNSTIPKIGEEAIAMLRQIPTSEGFFINQGNHLLLWSCAEKFRFVWNF